MYVPVKGGEAAIRRAHRLQAHKRRGDPAVPELEVTQIREQLSLAVDRVMTEGSCYDPDLAALAIKQAQGDLIEAIFLVRAYRTTLPRLGISRPLDTTNMLLTRRISATYKDLPGGQQLGPTFDFSHRLIDPALMAASEPEAPATAEPIDGPVPRVTDLLDFDSLIERDETDDDQAPADLTRSALRHPASRSLRLQALARGDEGFVLCMGYSGYGKSHPYAGEIRIGEVPIELDVPELDFPLTLGSVAVTECQMLDGFKGSEEKPPAFTRGYGLVFGRQERKAISMALLDRALRADELGEAASNPAQDEEFVLSHLDNVKATGFVEHVKLPHYVGFHAETRLLQRLRDEWERRTAPEEPTSEPARKEAAE
jgi:alpha-D-ribose 1-methylphosphonate 5-triphosphate synthase subunit PhnI